MITSIILPVVLIYWTNTISLSKLLPLFKLPFPLPFPLPDSPSFHKSSTVLVKKAPKGRKKEQAEAHSLSRIYLPVSTIWKYPPLQVIFSLFPSQITPLAIRLTRTPFTFTLWLALRRVMTISASVFHGISIS